MSTRRYKVYSLDMWGHVGADCVEHDCQCMVAVDGASEDAPKEHDENACQCGENCNQQFAAGEIDVTGDDDDTILDALFASGHLSEKGRAECEIDDYSNGPIDVNDREGRRQYHLIPIEGDE